MLMTMPPAQTMAQTGPMPTAAFKRLWPWRVGLRQLAFGSKRWFPRPLITWHRSIVQRFLQQPNLRRGRRVRVACKRNTLAVDHHHPLRAPGSFGPCTLSQTR
jgi:hypothetical protein